MLMINNTLRDTNEFCFQDSIDDDKEVNWNLFICDSDDKLDDGFAMQFMKRLKLVKIYGEFEL